MNPERERQLDELEDDNDATPRFEMRCHNCGAEYIIDPVYCRLCGSYDLEHIDDMGDAS